MSQKLVLFDQIEFSGTSRTYQNNDPDLVANGEDFLFESAIAVTGSWTLYDQVSKGGKVIQLDEMSGPDNDGTYRDSADWSPAGPFHVRSIEHS